MSGKELKRNSRQSPNHRYWSLSQNSYEESSDRIKQTSTSRCGLLPSGVIGAVFLPTFLDASSHDARPVWVGLECRVRSHKSLVSPSLLRVGEPPPKGTFLFLSPQLSLVPFPLLVCLSGRCQPDGDCKCGKYVSSVGSGDSTGPMRDSL